MERSRAEGEHPRESQEAFAEFLSRRDAGEGIDFDEFCSAYPDLKGQLSRLLGQWQQFSGVLDLLGASGSVSQRLREKYGSGVDPTISLESESRSEPPSADRLLQQITGRKGSYGRYRIKGEVARGGMGAILRVWDRDVRRHLAMKVILGKGPALETGVTPEVDARTLVRFLEEAQVTGQLDHPGVVPVHEIGLDADGGVYFTMRLVKGRNLREIFALVRDGKEDWTLTRALRVIVKACEAVAYAHSKGVIHRDLKPANIMVGKFGEVYVMDWGLAKVMGREDIHDLRMKPLSSTSFSVVQTEQSEKAAETPDSPIITMDGTVVGTPSYMPPEQAEGRVEELGPRSDVYSLGAILYQLLAGHMPYVPPGARMSARTVLLRVLDGPPRPLRELRPRIPPELEAICETAMARKSEDRYADMGELAADLHAYLDHRVVHAYEAGAWPEFKKWVDRNRALAVSVAAGLLVAVVGLGLLIWLQNKWAREEDYAADVFRLRSYLAEVEELWPPRAERIGELEAWLAGARKLRNRLATHERRLAAFRRAHLSAEEHAAALAGGAWIFDDATVQTDHDGFAELVEGLKALQSGDPAVSAIAEVEKRLEHARTVAQRTLEDAADEWKRAIASIADEEQCPLYGGLSITPQLGLIPIGRNPATGLWEFGHPLTGEVPTMDAEGRLAVTGETGLVFVLLPGGEFRMGAERPGEKTPLGAPNVDPDASGFEGPVHTVHLDPFFLSKYEMTQGQWVRLTYENPSSYLPGVPFEDKETSLLHPVETVSWYECDRLLQSRVLTLPTEAQWELAVRAGSSTIYSEGNDKESLVGAANLADQAALRIGVQWRQVHDWPELDDGFSVHAPVDSLRANAFGLHHMHGNVFEWCQDMPGTYTLPVREGTGERVIGAEDRARLYRNIRGGTFRYGPKRARCSYRYWERPKWTSYFTGVRPARALDR